MDKDKTNPAVSSYKQRYKLITVFIGGKMSSYIKVNNYCIQKSGEYKLMRNQKNIQRFLL